MRVLIIRIGALGDVAMSLQMGWALKEHTITWLVGKKSLPIVKWAGCAHEIITTDEDKLLGRHYGKKIGELMRVWKKLAWRSYDLVLTAHPDLRYRLMTLFCRKKEHRSFHHYPFRQTPVPGRFHPYEYLKLATGKFGPLYPFSLSTAPRNIIAIAPGGNREKEFGKFHRQWPIEHFQFLAQQLKKKGYQVAIIGGPDDDWILPYFTDFLCEVGTMSLPKLITFFESCRLTISHDSGPLHFARLGGSALLGLFGPTIPHRVVNLCDEKAEEFAIWGGSHLPCRPCYDGRGYERCQNNVCMRSISPKFVLEKAMDILHGKHSTDSRLAGQRLWC